MLASYPKAGLSSRDPRMTSMFRRGTIFATFFLSLLGGGLVCAALVTQHWVEARPWRTPNPQESAGRVHFGLLQGKKELNVAYGWRTYHVSGMLVLSAFLFVQRRLRFTRNPLDLSLGMIVGYRNLERYALWLLIVRALIGNLICQALPLAEIFNYAEFVAMQDLQLAILSIVQLCKRILMETSLTKKSCIIKSIK